MQGSGRRVAAAAIFFFVAGAATVYGVAYFFPNLMPRREIAPAWIDVGPAAISFKQLNFAGLEDIPNRTVSVEQREGTLKANTTVTDLVLKIQTRSLQSPFVYIGVQSCYAPRVENGRPIVQCREIGGETLHLTGDNSIRSQLMNIEREGKLAAVAGRIVGLGGGGGSLVVEVR